MNKKRTRTNTVGFFKLGFVVVLAFFVSKVVALANVADYTNMCIASALPVCATDNEGDFCDLVLWSLGAVNVTDGQSVTKTMLKFYDTKDVENLVLKEDTSQQMQLAPTETDEPEFAPVPENKLPILDVNTSLGAVKGYSSTCGVYLNNQTSYKPDLDSLLYAPLPFEVSGDGPTVLVISTHATEGYSERTGNWYDENDPTRTQDITKNVVRVGEEVARTLNENGIYTLHETALNDYPSYNGSYTRTLEVIEEYLKQFPTIKSVIDVHRDSMTRSDGTALRPVADINGERYAQVMLVAGSDEGGLDNPDWEKNLNYAVKITKEMNNLYPTLAKPINLRKERFNMHLTPGSLIAEVGTNVNTLEEAIRSGRCLGECIARVLKTP